MRKKLYKLAVLMMAVVMMLPSSTAFAAEVTTQTLNKNATSGKAKVVYDTSDDQTFTIIIPKKIILGSNKTAKYDVTVKGDVAQGSRVKVEPRDDVENTDNIDFEMVNQKTGISKNADVTQTDVYWDYSEITANDYEGTTKPGSIDGSKLTLGIWQGDLTFLINFEDEYMQEKVIGTPEELTDYRYELNDADKIVTLKRYIGDKTDVAVHSAYKVDYDIYETRISNSTFVPSNDSEQIIDREFSLFSYRDDVESISFDPGIDTSAVTNMGGMFYACENLKFIDLNHLDTSNVMNMSYMFYDCPSLTDLDLGSLDTGSVINMSHMFFDCKALADLNLNGFDTSNVTNMNYMFYDCNALANLDLESFDTSNVTDMNGMFSRCYVLKNLDLIGFDTSKVTTMNGMFSYCNVLTKLDLKSFDTSSVTDMSYMFNGCYMLNDLNISSFDTSSATNMSYMFHRCNRFTELDLSNFDTRNVANMRNMFSHSKQLITIDLSSFDTSKVTDMNCMFNNCSALQTVLVNAEKWNTSNADTGEMFSESKASSVIYK